MNTAGVFFAEERNGGKPTGRLIAYREYKAGDRSAAERCYHLMRGDACAGARYWPGSTATWCSGWDPCRGYLTGDALSIISTAA